ncbi:MAG: hypothetical protein SFV17_14870 [Candidatus Obscuribacter sp.]|nr:hypothetical protein [Candidatus Obscuribacter sp.]
MPSLPEIARKLVLTLSTVGGCLSLPLLAAAGAQPTEWLVVQSHESKTDAVIHVTHDAVKLESKALGCTLLTRAPDWKVHCYRPLEKIEWIGDMGQFSGMVMSNPYALPKPTLRGPAPRCVGETEMNGLKCKIYKGFASEVYCADSISVDPMVVLFFNRLYGTPLVPSVPLYERTHKRADRDLVRRKTDWIDTGVASDLRGGRLVKLTTSSCKSVPYNAKDFEVPRGYKRKVDLIEVSYSKDQRQEITDMLDNVGFESNLEHKRGKEGRGK